MSKKPNDCCSCPGKPELRIGKAVGMYHCEFCGAMVIAGLPHPSDEDVREQGVQPYSDWIKSLGDKSE